MIDEATDIMAIVFITFISISIDAGQTQMGTIKVNSMALGPRRYEIVAKADKHQAPGAEDHEVNAIGKCEVDIRADTCCSGKNWRLL